MKKKAKEQRLPLRGGAEGYSPNDYIRLGLPAVDHLLPEFSTPLQRKLATHMAKMRVRDIFDEVETTWPPERLKTPEQVAIAIQEVLFNNYEDQLLKLIGHRIPV